MNREKYLHLRKLFIIGIIVSLVTVLGGEIPIGWVVNPDADNELMSILMGYANLSLLQLASGVFFGGIAIPLQYYGYKAIGEIAEMGGHIQSPYCKGHHSRVCGISPQHKICQCA